MYVKCQGSNFGTNRQVIIKDDYSDAEFTTLPTKKADPTQIVVAKIRIYAPHATISVKNLANGLTSDPVTITIDPIPTGQPGESDVYGPTDPKQVLVAGGSADIEEDGDNLTGFSDGDWTGIPGLTFTNTTVQPYQYGDHIQAHVVATAETPISGDDATNLQLIRKDKYGTVVQQTNEFAFTIAPP